MIRIPLLDPDALLLTPRWGELGGWLQSGLLAGLCLAPLLLVLWLYRYELQLLTRGAALALLALRLLTLAVLLVLVCLEPVFARTSTHEVEGRVLLVIDRSDSMKVADPQREPAEALRLARALKLHQGLCDDVQLDAWLRQYDAGVRPGDASSPRQVEVIRRVNAMSRAELAERLLSADGGRLLDAVRRQHRCELLGFARGGRWADADEWKSLFTPGDKDADLLTRSTDLAFALEQVQERSRRRSGPVLGVVLLSDGRHNAPNSPVQKAAELGQLGVPLYPVALGARKPPADVAVLDVIGPSNTFKNVDAPFEVRFRVTSLAPQSLTVRLHRPGQEQTPIEERVVEHDGTDREYTEKFQLRLEDPGTQRLVATVRPVARDVAEASHDNNRRAHALSVANDQARVLLVEGEARWEYHYLFNALKRDPTVKLEAVVFTQPRLDLVPEEELLEAGHPALALPPEPDALAKFDCVILGDVSPDELPARDRERLEKYVADHGGTLVVLAGKRGMPLAYRPEGDNPDPLTRLLPVEGPAVHRDRDGFAVTLTPEGKAAAFLQMEADPARNDERWERLPPHRWGVPGKAKPGAVVLATPGRPEPGATAADQLRWQREHALVARHHYGFGRVFYVGLDSTWRWRFREGDTYHHRFWGQTVRWAASDRPLPAGNEHVRFGTPEPVYHNNDPVRVLARFDDTAIPLGADARARIFLAGAREGEKPVAVVPLRPGRRLPRLLEAQVNNLPSGDYEIELAIPALADKLRGPAGPDGATRALRAAFTVAAPDDGEAVDLATNRPLMQELARRSGAARVYEAEEAAELIDLLKGRTVTYSEQAETKLWQWWVTLAAVVTLLTAEWALRKWAGLP